LNIATDCYHCYPNASIRALGFTQYPMYLRHLVVHQCISDSTINNTVLKFQTIIQSGKSVKVSLYQNWSKIPNKNPETV